MSKLDLVPLKDPSKFVLNPKTNKYVKVGSKTYQRLFKSIHEIHLPQPESQQTEPNLINQGIVDIATSIIADNINEIPVSDMTDAQLDSMLKRLLLDKLRPKIKPKKTKTKPKKQFKISVPSDSEESEISD